MSELHRCRSLLKNHCFRFVVPSGHFLLISTVSINYRQQAFIFLLYIILAKFPSLIDPAGELCEPTAGLRLGNLYLLAQRLEDAD